MPGGFLGNLASDVVGSLRSPRLYKNLRDTPSYKEKGYNFAYNLGTFSSVTGANVGGLRSGLYNSLQASNTMKSLSGKSQSRMRSGTRRLAFRGAAMVTSNIMRSMLPQGAGLAGRFVRASAGRFSARRLQRFDMKVQEVLYGNFSVDSKKIDKYVQSPNTKIGMDLQKIQRAMHAIAISNAPDPYHTHRFNRGNGVNDIDQLGQDDKIMSSFSLNTFDGDDIDALLSRKDISDIMGQNALAGAPASRQMVGGANSQETGRIMESLYAPNEGGHGAFNKTHQPTLSRGNAETLARHALEESGVNAEYAFGTGALSGMALQEKVIQFITEAAIAADKFGARSPGPTGLGSNPSNHKQFMQAMARSLQDKLAAGGPELIDALGKGVEVARYLHGDDGESVTGYNAGKRYNKSKRGSMEIYTKDRQPVEFETEIETVVENKRMVTGPSTDYRVTGEDYDGGGNYRGVKGTAVPGPLLDTPISVPGRDPVKEIRKKNLTNVKKVNVGSLNYGKNKRIPKTESTPIHTKETLQVRFSDQPKRHNFVPNKRQIQSAIHALDPDTKQKKATVVYAVAFGGKSKRSHTNDSIRDSYQIEYGGPGTDRQGKLTNRTDHFVFTPSLFMYRSAIGTAKAFGLGVSSGRNIVAHLQGSSAAGMSQAISGSTLNNVYVQARGMKPANKQQQRILQEMYQKSAKSSNNPVFEGGQLMLSKNKVLASTYDKASLDLVSEVLNDTMFGGQAVRNNLLRDRRNLGNTIRGSENANPFYDRRPFEQVMDTPTAESMIHKLQKEQGQARMYMPSDEFIDEQIVGLKFDSPDRIPTGFNVIESIDPKTGEPVFQIGSRQFDAKDLVIDEEGKTYIPGNVINARTKKNITSLDSAMDYETPGVRDDMHILLDLERLGIKDIDDPRMMSMDFESKISRSLQFNNINTKLERAFRQNMTDLAGVLDEQQIVEFSQRLTNNLLNKLSKGTYRHAGGGGSGIPQLGPIEINLIAEFYGAQMTTLNSVLKKNTFTTRRLKNNQKTSRTDILGKVDADQVRLDASLSQRQFGIMMDEKGMDVLQDIFNENTYIEAVLNGDMTVRDAVAASVRDSHRKLGRLQSEVRNPIDETIPNVSGKKRHRTNIPNTTIGTSGRTGEPDTFRVQETSFIDKKIDAEEKKFKIKTGSTRAQLAYVDSELQRIRFSTKVNVSINHILRKCSKSPFIQQAWIRYMAQDPSIRDTGMNDGSINSIREYLEIFFTNNG